MSQQTIKAYLSRAMIRQRLSHAILLVGEDDDTQKAIAQSFAMMLLCEKKRVVGLDTIVPCESCIDCNAISQQRHTNVQWMAPVSSDDIKIDQVRELKESLRLSSFDQRSRLIIFESANALTTQAANALLKSIEEPHEGQYFLLMARSSSALPRTLVSRCQRLTIPTSSQNDRAQNETTQLAQTLWERIRKSDFNSRIGLVDEIAKLDCDKNELLMEIQKHIHGELREHSASSLKKDRERILASIESIEQARQLINNHVNTQLTLESWLLNSWTSP